MSFIRRLFYLVLGSLAVALSFAALGRLLASTGALAVLGISEWSVVRAGMVLAWAGAVLSWAMGREVAVWSVNARPWEERDLLLAGPLPETVSRLAGRFGLPQPELAVYPSREVNAFAIGRGRRVLLAVSSGLLTRTRPEEAEAVIAHELARVAGGDVTTLLLVQGLVWVFTLFPARMVALLCGTSLRTAEEETSSDAIEVGVIATLEVLLVPFASLVARRCARAAEARADRVAARVVGSAPLTEALRVLAQGGAATPLREVFTAPLKFGAAVRPWLRLVSYHLPVAVRLRALGAPSAG